MMTKTTAIFACVICLFVIIRSIAKDIAKIKDDEK